MDVIIAPQVLRQIWPEWAVVQGGAAPLSKSPTILPPPDQTGYSPTGHTTLLRPTSQQPRVPSGTLVSSDIVFLNLAQDVNIRFMLSR